MERENIERVNVLNVVQSKQLRLANQRSKSVATSWNKKASLERLAFMIGPFAIPGCTVLTSYYRTPWNRIGHYIHDEEQIALAIAHISVQIALMTFCHLLFFVFIIRNKRFIVKQWGELRIL